MRRKDSKARLWLVLKKTIFYIRWEQSSYCGGETMTIETRIRRGINKDREDGKTQATIGLRKEILSNFHVRDRRTSDKAVLTECARVGIDRDKWSCYYTCCRL
jgi:hypothetical protein